MTRSLKKNPFVANNLLKKINKLNTKEEKEIIIIKFGRTTGIEPAHGGFTIHCLDPLGYIRPSTII
uniref:ribosomal protein S19 n=1 Tax=Rudbeckia hirta TaxID=52299 RepID=UPI00286CA8C2|nr:ribosomal protein S19 [Rudbeckia hirta]WKN51251.1 ribosomal protein S19 [Rudbeckia hirta]